MKKEILFIAATHGDEKIGEKVLSKLEKDGKKSDWIIGNPEAFVKSRRCCDVDLNRCAPGNINSKKYEEKRAAEILKITKNYKYVIDIHGTTANSGIFAIVTNPTIENLIFATSLPVKNVVIWVAKKKEIINPLSEFFPCGLELECGPKDSDKTKKGIEKIIEKIINKTPSKIKQNFYQVYGRIDGNWDKGLKDFQSNAIGQEKFYPILSNQYEGIKCYKMKRLNLLDLLSY